MNHARKSNSALPSSFQELHSQYERHRLVDLGRSPETVAENLRYTRRFVALTGRGSPKELFKWLTFRHVQRLIFEYRERHGPGSSANFQADVRVFLKYCFQRGHADGDYSVAVPSFRIRRLSSVPKAMPPECVSGLLASLDDSTARGARDLAIVRLLATYGVRGVQVRRLRLSDIDWNSEEITFPSAKRGKAVRQPLTIETGDALCGYLRKFRPRVDSPEVFLTSSAPWRPLSTSTELSKIIRDRLREAGVEPPAGVSRGTHGFRHAFGARLVGRVPMKVLADMLGHRDMSSTLVYGKVDLASLREAALPWPEVDHE